MSAVIGATHVLCAIGNGTEQVWASARAGIARIRHSRLMDQYGEPIPMGLVPNKALGKLPPEIEKLPLPARARRILRLAAPSFLAVAKGITDPVALFIGLPELSHEQAPWLAHVPSYLQVMTGVAVDRHRSVVVPYGRAAGLMALERALEALRHDPGNVVIVGGVDSYRDRRLMDVLEAENRILGTHVADGFVPGEGAAFYVLSGANTTDAAPRQAQVIVHAAAVAMDEGHRYGQAPATGEGLSAALAQLRERSGYLSGPIATTFAGLNGESFDAKLWGVARLRHNDFFSPTTTIDHPADKYGDAGAATGAILVALAAESLASGARTGPALVWAASDREPRACAVVSARQR